MTSIAGSRVGGLPHVPKTTTPDDITHNPKSVSSAPFAGNTSAWNSGIWGKSIIGSGMRNGLPETRPQRETFAPVSSAEEPIIGSRSLLASSESDTSTLRNPRWNGPENASGLGSNTLPRSRGSPERIQQGHFAPAGYAEDSAADSSFFSVTPASTSISSRSSQKNFLEPSHDFASADGLASNTISGYQKHRDDEYSHGAKRNNGFGFADRNFRSANRRLGSNEIGGYSSSAGSRSGSLPPSRDESRQGWRSRIETSTPAPGRYDNHPNPAWANSAASGTGYTSSGKSFGQGLEANPPVHLDSLSGGMDKLSLSAYKRPSYASSQPSPNALINRPPSSTHTHTSASDSQDPWNPDFNDPAIGDSVSPTDSNFLAYQKASQYRSNAGPHGYHGTESDRRANHQAGLSASSAGLPAYAQQSHTVSGSRTPYPSTSGTQAAILENKLKGLQHQQQQPPYLPGQHDHAQFRNQIPFPYDVSTHQPFRMNLLASYYPVAPAPHLLNSTYVPRGANQDHDLAGQMRSPLLEEFRNSSKTNRRYELKDIYGYIVEFSGDQHGSRFIQQKLETANSDEKDQIFRELHPNARQLMTDVFGNYVIQKFFEHGNQTQKKMLANQMKNYVLTLSNQMYGCRVVQKALEHILTDQQASLIRELEQDVMRCVKDQNGNHVVQKAIERVPAEHIQFIINAFHGKVGENATHPYGCRVIQRMLEHCDDRTRSSILQELHACASSLINDQYGNYVTQHVIEHGHPEDRNRIINLIIYNIVNYSKHKFASNVVEKSIEFGSPQDRQRIVQTLTQTNERGESPVQSLIRDQYGNYVVQKLLTQLKGQEWIDFAEPVKLQVILLKRFNYGKQIASVEKLLYGGQIPTQPAANGNISPLGPPHVSHIMPHDTSNVSAAGTPSLVSNDTQSPQSGSLSSTHTVPLDVSIDAHKPANALNILEPGVSN